MAITRCPQCNQRISSHAPSCPHCHAELADMAPEDRLRLRQRRWRSRIYRARNFTYLAMALVLLGAIGWWFASPQGLLPPMPVGAGVAMGLGVIGYVSAWVWILWLRLPSNRPR